MTEQLLGLAELAELYGVTKATASNWSRRHTFPPPVQHLKMGPVWRRSDVVDWKPITEDRGQECVLLCAWCGDDEFAEIYPIADLTLLRGRCILCDEWTRFSFKIASGILQTVKAYAIKEEQ